MSFTRLRSSKLVYAAGLQVQKAVTPSIARTFSHTTRPCSQSGARSHPANMQSTEDQASLITKETSSESPVSHEPDYDARVDHGTS